MSLSLNTPDSDYDMTLFSGAWARERHPHTHHLHEGIQEISSLRNASGHFLNRTAILSTLAPGKPWVRPMGVGFVYSGNFDLYAEVDTYQVTRIQTGINDTNFAWRPARTSRPPRP